MAEPTMNWNKYGKDYNEVNRNLGGLPDWLRQTGQWLGQGFKQNWEQVWKPYVYKPAATAINMALGGLPRGVLKTLAPGRETLGEEFERERPQLSGIAKGAGLAGAILAPQAAAAKGITLGTQAAGFLPSLARNALISGAYAVPAAGGEALETGNIPKAVKHGLISTALGTGIGMGAEALSKILDPVFINAQAQALGLSPKDLRKTLLGAARAAGYGPKATAGYAVKAAPVLKQTIGNLAQRFGLGKKGAQAIVDYVDKGYKNLGGLYDSAGIRMADHLDEIATHPDINLLRKVHGAAVDDEILNLAQQVDDVGWNRAYGGILTNEETAGLKAIQTNTRDPQGVRGAIASVIKNKIGEFAENLRLQSGKSDVPSLFHLNQIYGASKAVRESLARQLSNIGQLALGSETAPRMGMMRMLSPQRVGTAIGGLGVGGGEAVYHRPKTVAEVPGYVGRVALATILGSLVGRMGIRAARTGLGYAARGLEAALPVAGRAGQVLAARGGVIPALESIPPPPETYGQPPAAEETIPTEPTQTANIKAKEQQVEPGQVKQAQTQTNTAFRDRIMQTLHTDWQRVNAAYAGTPQEISFEEFVGSIQKLTNDFDPKRSAPILFRDPKERERYLATYDRALGLQGLDVPRALSWEGGLKGFLGDQGESARQQKAYTDLENMMMQMLAGPGKLDDPQMRRIVETDIANIRRLRVSPQMKRQALQDLLQTNYGLDLNMLRQYGLEI